MNTFEEVLAGLIRTVIQEELANFYRESSPTVLPSTGVHPPRIAYTIKEAAAASGASENHIRSAIILGELHAKQAGTGKTGRYIIPADCLQAWLHGLPQPVGARRKSSAG